MDSNRTKPGWYPVFDNKIDQLVGIDVQTNMEYNTIQTVAFQHHFLHDMWSAFKATTGTVPNVAKGATGSTGIANVTLPKLSTVCVSAAHIGSNDTMWAEGPQSSVEKFPSSDQRLHWGCLDYKLYRSQL